MGKTPWDVPNFLKEGLPVGIMGIGGHISYHISFSLDWAGYLLISDLKTNPTCMTPKLFLEFDFSRNCEKSVPNSWEHEIGYSDIMRLTTKKRDLVSLFFIKYIKKQCKAVCTLVHVYSNAVATSLAGLQLLKNTRVNINLTMNKQNLFYLKRR